MEALPNTPDFIEGTKYVFTQKSKINTAETDPKLAKFTKDLGFGHIYLIVVTVRTTSKVTKGGDMKGQVTKTLDLEGQQFDMVVNTRDKTKVAARRFPWNNPQAAVHSFEYKGTTTQTNDDIEAHGESLFLTPKPNLAYDAISQLIPHSSIGVYDKKPTLQYRPQGK